jgi:GNAT superfamily N-acetyltransferase
MACDGPVHLRRAETGDAAGIADVHVRSWRRSHEGLIPLESLAFTQIRQREESWRTELQMEALDRRPWVALVDDRVVGFATAGLSRDEDSGPDVGEVYHVYVAPECWGRGIGRNLLAHAVRDLQRHGFTRATFWVLAPNEGTRRWAERQGWGLDGAAREEDWAGTSVKQVRYAHQLR